MKVCKRCGAPLRENDRYCSQCGARVPESRDEKRKRQKREKEKREIHFQAEPGRRKAVDSFEEYENRGSALKMTVKVLIVIIILTAATVFVYAWHSKIGMFRQSPGKEQAIVVLQSEEAEADRLESELSVRLEPGSQGTETASGK